MTAEAVAAGRPTSLFGRFWRCAAGFWVGRSARWAWPLVALLVVLAVLQLVVQYRLNLWNRDFFNALERRQPAAILEQAGLFLPLVACSVTLAVLAVWGRMTCQRRWRGWLTAILIDRWIGTGGYRQIDLVGGEHQNVEYRITEDARIATDAPVDFAVGLLSSILMGITFIGVLWNVGGGFVVEAYGGVFVVPGYLVVAVVAYSLLTTAATTIIGRRMVDVVERKNQAESELKYAAAHLRESAQNGGTKLPPDRAGLEVAVGSMLATWRNLAGQHMRTTVVSHGNTLLAPVVGLILCAPKYLAGTMHLGEVTQAAAAFVAVQSSFNWLVDNYPRLADWMSSVNRVANLLRVLDELERPGMLAPLEDSEKAEQTVTGE
jgi:putative ATP-binding cassette transporter